MLFVMKTAFCTQLMTIVQFGYCCSCWGQSADASFTSKISPQVKPLMNPHATGLFLFPLKTENQRFPGAVKRDQCYEISNQSIKEIYFYCQNECTISSVNRKYMVIQKIQIKWQCMYFACKCTYRYKYTSTKIYNIITI